MHQQKQPFETSTDPNVKGRMQNMTGQVTSNRLLHCYVTGSLTVEKGYSTQKTTNNMGALSDKISCAVAMDYVIPRSRFTSGYKLQTVKSNKKYINYLQNFKAYRSVTWKQVTPGAIFVDSLYRPTEDDIFLSPLFLARDTGSPGRCTTQICRLQRKKPFLYAVNRNVYVRVK